MNSSSNRSRYDNLTSNDVERLKGRTFALGLVIACLVGVLCAIASYFGGDLSSHGGFDWVITLLWTSVVAFLLGFGTIIIPVGLMLGLISLISKHTGVSSPSRTSTTTSRPMNTTSARPSSTGRSDRRRLR